MLLAFFTFVKMIEVFEFSVIVYQLKLPEMQFVYLRFGFGL